MISSFGRLTNANAQTVEYDRILEKGQRAPWYGILVPENTYRDYQAAIIENQNLYNYAKESSPDKGENYLLVLFTGVLVGAGTAYLLQNK